MKKFIIITFLSFLSSTLYAEENTDQWTDSKKTDYNLVSVDLCNVLMSTQFML